MIIKGKLAVGNKQLANFSLANCLLHTANFTNK